MEETAPTFESELRALLKQEKAKTKRSLTKLTFLNN